MCLRQCIWRKAQMSSYIPFSSRPCPKPAVFFFKTIEVLNGLGRAEIALECKWFLYLTLFSEDLLFSNGRKMGERGKKASLRTAQF